MIPRQAVIQGHEAVAHTDVDAGDLLGGIPLDPRGAVVSEGVEAHNGGQRAVLYPADVQIGIGIPEVPADIAQDVRHGRRRARVDRVLQLGSQSLTVAEDISRPLEAVAVGGNVGRVRNVGGPDPVDVREEPRAVISVDGIGQGVVHILTQQVTVNAGEGGIQTVAPVTVIPPRAHALIQLFLQIFGKPVQLIFLQHGAAVVADVIVHDGQHAQAGGPGIEFLNVAEQVGIDVVTRGTAQAPIGVHHEHVQGEILLTVGFDQLVDPAVGQFYIAGIPQA